MPFRADESAKKAFEHLKNEFVIRRIDSSQVRRSIEKLEEIADEYGPVITSYPTWHPLVTHHDDRYPVTHPNKECRYKGLDHTRHFAHAFITCPYGDGQDVIDSVNQLPDHPVADIEAERLDIQLYHPKATPILVKCRWRKTLTNEGLVPMSLAVPLILEKEVPGWRWAQVAENWNDMRPYLLGEPHGSRSSLFVSQETGLVIKKMWNLLITTGMYGNIRPSQH
ncbi:hypothetical protein ACK8HJ_21195 [Vreelandella titanicae]|uniref:hypothetical protein n=1 Tax=Vreelandella titanicae TaxID=664683 RepID=UPI003986E782|tara:strand:- start:390 stop:1061 length:672 start_codon:yes stop_codon:yes gene_type:complete